MRQRLSVMTHTKLFAYNKLTKHAVHYKRSTTKVASLCAIPPPPDIPMPFPAAEHLLTERNSRGLSSCMRLTAWLIFMCRAHLTILLHAQRPPPPPAANRGIFGNYMLQWAHISTSRVGKQKREQKGLVCPHMFADDYVSLVHLTKNFMASAGNA